MHSPKAGRRAGGASGGYAAHNGGDGSGNNTRGGWEEEKGSQPSRRTGGQAQAKAAARPAWDAGDERGSQPVQQQAPQGGLEGAGITDRLSLLRSAKVKAQAETPRASLIASAWRHVLYHRCRQHPGRHRRALTEWCLDLCFTDWWVSCGAGVCPNAADDVDFASRRRRGGERKRGGGGRAFEYAACLCGPPNRSPRGEQTVRKSAPSRNSEPDMLVMPCFCSTIIAPLCN